MASIQNKKLRHERDFYETPALLTRSFMQECPFIRNCSVLDPCAGDRAITRELQAWEDRQLEIYATDINDDEASPIEENLHLFLVTLPGAEGFGGLPGKLSGGTRIALNATRENYWQRWSGYCPIDWVVTNPPFKEAQNILPLAFEHARCGVAFLLRISYLEPCSNRSMWLKEYADNQRLIMPFSPRPRFRPDSRASDSATVVWIVWDKQFSWKRLGLRSPFQYISGWR